MRFEVNDTLTEDEIESELRKVIKDGLAAQTMVTLTGGVFIVAFLIGLYSIHRLALVKEAGWVKEKIVVRELIAEVKRPLRNFSTAGGLRHMLHILFSIVRTTGERPKAREAQKKQQ